MSLKSVTFDPTVRYKSAPLCYSAESEWKRSLTYVSKLESPMSAVNTCANMARNVAYLTPLSNSIKGWDATPWRIMKFTNLVLGITAFASWFQNGPRRPQLKDLQQVFLFLEGIGTDSLLSYAFPSLRSVFKLLLAALNFGCYVQEESATSVHQLNFYKLLFALTKALLACYVFTYAFTLAICHSLAVGVGKLVVYRL